MTRAIGQLLCDPDALETSFTDVVNTIRLFTEDNDDVDILQGALLRVFASNLKLRTQILRIARPSHVSKGNDDGHNSIVRSDTGNSEDSQPDVNAGADVPTAFALSEVSAEKLHLPLLQKLTMNVLAESTAPADTRGTGSMPSPG